MSTEAVERSFREIAVPATPDTACFPVVGNGEDFGGTRSSFPTGFNLGDGGTDVQVCKDGWPGRIICQPKCGDSGKRSHQMVNAHAFLTVKVLAATEEATPRRMAVDFMMVAKG